MPIPQLKTPSKPEAGTIPHAPSSMPPTKLPRQRRPWRRVILVSVLGLVLTFGVFAANAIVVGNRVLGGNGNVSFFDQLKHLIIPPEKTLRGETEDRINILLLGIGGSGHEGPLLTDTIIVASLRPSTKDVSFLSIPRDLVVPFPKYEWRKINNALAFGLWLDYPGGGEALMQEMVELVTGLPVHYKARVDFAGFRKIVDDLGGINVVIDKPFVDRQYPDENFGFQTISFSAGVQHLSGERALQFVRSRYGSGGEGSDFARSKRQQKVLVAVKEKALSFGTLVNPKRITDALATVGQHAWSNLELWEVLRFAKLIEGVSADRVATRVLDASPGSPLVASTSPSTGYILQPRRGNFEDIHYIAAHLFDLAQANAENAAIAVENGTKNPNLGQEVAAGLTNLNYRVVRVGPAKTQDYEETIIYDFTAGTKPYTLASLREQFDAKIQNGLPSFFDGTSDPGKAITPGTPTNSNAVDILLIVGDDQEALSPVAKTRLQRLPTTPRS